jgi:RNA polymerase sigma factor for flagellar operon FliA
MMTKSNRDELILAHLLQVELLARRLHRRCPQVELDDLISAGTVGLIQAVDRFDPSRNLKLKTLAEHRISGALLDYLRYIDPLPRNVRRFQKQRDTVMAEFSSIGATPSNDEIADALGVTSQRYARLSLIITASETISIEEPGLARRLTG